MYFLLEGGGVPGVGGSGSIMNLHLAQIAKNAIYLGYFLVLDGSVRFRKFEPTRRQNDLRHVSVENCGFSHGFSPVRFSPSG